MEEVRLTWQVDKYQRAEARRKGSARLPSRESRSWMDQIRSGAPKRESDAGYLGKVWLVGCETRSGHIVVQDLRYRVLQSSYAPSATAQSGLKKPMARAALAPLYKLARVVTTK